MGKLTWTVFGLLTGLSGQTLQFERTAVLGPEIPDFSVPRPPVVADFNGDGILDMVVSSGGSVWLFLGSGGGRFLPPQVVAPFAASDGPCAVGDLNGDGNPDLVLP